MAGVADGVAAAGFAAEPTGLAGPRDVAMSSVLMVEAAETSEDGSTVVGSRALGLLVGTMPPGRSAARTAEIAFESADASMPASINASRAASAMPVTEG